MKNRCFTLTKRKSILVISLLIILNYAFPLNAKVEVTDVTEVFTEKGVNLKKGDRIVSYSSDCISTESKEITISSYYDWVEMFHEKRPCCAISLYIERGREKVEVKMLPFEWKFTVQPEVPEDSKAILSLAIEKIENLEESDIYHIDELDRETPSPVKYWYYNELTEALISSGRIDEAELTVKLAAREAIQYGNLTSEVYAWLLSADLLEKTGVYDRAEEYYSKAIELCIEKGDKNISMAWSLAGLGLIEYYRSNLDEGYKYVSDALAIGLELAPESLETAWYYNNLGLIAEDRGELDKSYNYHNEALKIRLKVAPNSYDTSASYNNMGTVLWRQGRYAEAESAITEALEIRERVIPGDKSIAYCYNNLGLIVDEYGDLSGAEEYYTKALEIIEQTIPGGQAEAHIKNNLALILKERGFYAEAEKIFIEALEIMNEIAPATLVAAQINNNLGIVCRHRNELDDAEKYFYRAYEIKKDKSPDSINLALTIDNLGLLYKNKGDFEKSRYYHEKALEIITLKAPGSTQIIDNLINQGALAQKTDDLEGAHKHYSKALELSSVLRPKSLRHSDILYNFGILAMYDNNEAAMEFFQKALKLISNIAPGSEMQSMTYHKMAQIVSMKDHEKGSELYEKALNALETQLERLGGSAISRASFKSQHLQMYHHYIELLLEMEEDEKALEILERSRAQMLLMLITEKDLAFSSDIDEELDKEKRIITKGYEDLWNNLAGISTDKDSEELAELHEQLAQKRVELDRIKEEIKEASPRLAALTYPETLSFDDIVNTLDPNTLLIEYSVHSDRIVIFALNSSKRELKSIVSETGKEELLRKIRHFRTAITHEGDFTEPASTLSDILLKPLKKEIARADSIVICPDGVLNALPFSALKSPLKKGKRFRYLIQDKPVIYSLSMTVYKDLLKRESLDPDHKIIAFGDPVYKEGPDRNSALIPLPFSADEISSIGDIFGESGDIYRKENATESKARSIEGNMQSLHFACHGIVNEKSPLDSSLALSSPNSTESEYNGFLQAWEILEQLRFNSELVVLSSCSSGLGKIIEGEGTIGLTRAFQYAGARSVLSSLWNINDMSTSVFMNSFYKHLDKNAPVDAALREAQKELIDSDKYSHPFHWAAFTLNGAVK